MIITLRTYSTRTKDQKTVLASLEENGKGEFTVRDGRVVISTLPAAEKAEATITYEALRQRLMLARRED